VLAACGVADVVAVAAVVVVVGVVHVPSVGEASMRGGDMDASGRVGCCERNG